MFDLVDLDGNGFVPLEFLLKPKKFTDPFLLR